MPHKSMQPVDTLFATCEEEDTVEVVMGVADAAAAAAAAIRLIPVLAVAAHLILQATRPKIADHPTIRQPKRKISSIKVLVVSTATVVLLPVTFATKKMEVGEELTTRGIKTTRKIIMEQFNTLATHTATHTTTHTTTHTANTTILMQLMMTTTQMMNMTKINHLLTEEDIAVAGVRRPTIPKIFNTIIIPIPINSSKDSHTVA